MTKAPVLRLAVDNDGKSVVDVAHALWAEGHDRIAIVCALMDTAFSLTDHPCPDAVLELLVPIASEAEAREAVLEALYRWTCARSPD